MSAVREEQRETRGFPAQGWFEALADLMNANRARQEQLGYIDCTVVFTVSDGSVDKLPRHFQVTFEEFSAVDVREVDAALAVQADFALEASFATWRAMIESIAAGGGRPALNQTLNYLSHMGTPMTLVAADPIRSDLYYRYNQSLQEFINASAAFDTEFPVGR
jgi:hypothetical protein